MTMTAEEAVAGVVAYLQWPDIRRLSLTRRDDVSVCQCDGVTLP